MLNTYINYTNSNFTKQMLIYTFLNTIERLFNN